jgi:hypothetical protein
VRLRKSQKMDEEVDVTRFSSESDDLNIECAARCEQCHELFDANSIKLAISTFGHPGMHNWHV